MRIDAVELLIVAVGVLTFGWLVYRERVALIEWVAIEALAFRDAALARRTARVHWRGQLKEARAAKVIARMESR